MFAVIGGWNVTPDGRRLCGAEYPAWQNRRSTVTTGRTQIIGVIHLDQRRLLRIVGINNTAIVVIVLLPQQGVQRIDTPCEFATMQRVVWQGFTDLVEIPLTAFHAQPKCIKLLPLQHPQKPALQSRMERHSITVIHDDYSHPAILSRLGTPPACTTLLSTTTPGVDITPWAMMA